MEMRAHGGRGAEPQATGTASHFPSDVPRYSTALLTGPYCLISASTTSFTGVELVAVLVGSPLVEGKDVVPAPRLRLGRLRENRSCCRRRE